MIPYWTIIYYPGFWVYYFNWPQSNNLRSFGNKLVSQYEPFCSCITYYYSLYLNKNFIKLSPPLG